MSFKSLANRLLLLVAILFLFIARPGYAHGDGEIGDYLLVVGFAVEPAFEGQPNGAEVFITHHSDGEPVEGIADTLQVEITHIPSGVSKIFELQEAFGEPGRYIAHFIPTAPGAYRFRFFGQIEEQTVDATFESGSGSFDEVQPQTNIQFPEPLPAGRELEAAVRGSQQTSDEALATATSTRIIAIGGLLSGLVGLGLGLTAILRRK